MEVEQLGNVVYLFISAVLSSIEKYMLMKNLAVIPARGGSKGIPSKNLVDIGGKSLIYWTILSALESNVFDYIHVSTDSEAIMDAAIDAGACCEFLRPGSLSGDAVGTSGAILHSIEKLEERGLIFENVFELQPTYLFRDKFLIRDFISYYENVKSDFLVTCVKIQDTGHPDYAIIEVDDFCKFGVYKPDQFSRQNLSSIFSCHGVLLGGNIKKFCENGSFFSANVRMFEIKEKLFLIDINDSFDLELARIIIDKEWSKGG